MIEGLEQLRSIFEAIRTENMYGEVLLKFEAGKMVLIKKTETIKPYGLDK